MRIDRARVAWCCAFAATLGFLAGCPGKLDDKQSFVDYVPAEAGAEAAAPMEAGPGAGGDPTDAACGDIIDRVFAPSCGDTGCHGAVAPQQGLDLVSPNVASRLVGIAGQACVSVLADPSDPEGSLLFKKLLPAPGCGAQMPLARPPI
ncbi:MAG: hypothetical protein ABIQ16_12760, partial [Polyangiaceae bacterium]